MYMLLLLLLLANDSLAGFLSYYLRAGLREDEGNEGGG